MNDSQFRDVPAASRRLAAVMSDLLSSRSLMGENRAAQGRRERRYWEYRRDRGRSDATVRSRSPATGGIRAAVARPGARELGINHLASTGLDTLGRGAVRSQVGDGHRQQGSGRMSTIEHRPTDVSLEEFEAIFESVKNWGRWGDDDIRGTLNLLTPEHVKRASG